MKKLWSRIRNDWLLAVVVVMFLITGGIGVTYAYNQHNTELDNFLRASSVASEILENGSTVGENNQLVLTPNEKTAKKVQFKNTGESDVFVRVTFSERWVTNDGEWLENNEAYVTLDWTSEWAQEWQQKDDGWYYYKKVLPSKAITKEVLASVGFTSLENLSPAYQKSTYQLFFTMEVLQVSDEEAVNEGALKKVFGRTATVTNGVVEWN